MGSVTITSMTATISASSTMYLVLNFVAEVRVALIVFILSPLRKGMQPFRLVKIHLRKTDDVRCV